METLDPQVAKKLEEEALKNYQEKSAPPSKSQKSATENFYHSKVIGRFKSVFPFELFPDELILSERRAIWIHRYGPGMSRVISVLYQDIADIEASTGPIIGHLHIRNFTGGEEIVIEHLWKKDLQKARDIVEGMMLKFRVGLKGAASKQSAQEKLERTMHIDF